MTTIQDCISKLGYKTIDSSYYTFIASWMSWYRGKVEKFHNYTVYNGKKQNKCERATLGMAKKICEDWANLILNEKVDFSTSDEGITKLVKDVFAKSNFRVRGNRLVELAFAMGTGAFVEYLDKKEVKIDYIRADMIYPISWSNGEITECAFGSEMVIGNKKCIYIQLHLLQKGKYVIINKLFNKDTSEELPLPEGVQGEYHTNSEFPLFQIIKPNIVNNIDLDCPMGVSVYSNVIDVLKGVDLVYDSYCNEFRLGKKRIVVPMGMAQIQATSEGALKPVFDDNDTEFYALPDKNLTEIKEINMEIRSQAHKEGLHEQLNLLSDRTGLGTNRYSFENKGVKTATEVISEQSSLYQNLKKHELIFEAALCNMIKAIAILSGRKVEELEVKVDFDDSIIRDRDAEKTQYLQYVSSGIMQPYEFRMRVFNEDEETAKSKIPMSPFLDDGSGDE